MVATMKERRITALSKAIADAIDGGDGSFGSWDVGAKHDSPGSPAANVFSHGPLGNLTFPGVDPTVFNSAVGNIGILSSLPATPSIYTDPTFAVLTGVKDVTGSNKENVCDVAPTAGLMKVGMLHSQWGRYELSTPEMDLTRLGQRNDRADPMDLTLLGSPIGEAGPFGGLADPNMPGDLLTNEISRKFWELDMAFHRLISKQLWTGSPTNNSAGGGYKEMVGFDSLIITGHTDAETNVPLPTVDADLQDFGNNRIDVAGGQLVKQLSYLYMTRKDRAFRSGMAPVRWVLAMRQDLFWEISNVWPCSYLTYMCNTGLGSNVTTQINAADQVKMRDDMRNGRYLLINGDRIEVVIDDGIAYNDGNSSGGNFPAGCMRSNIYLIPMSVVGGRAVTYLEYEDFDNASLNSALAALGAAGTGVEKQGAFLLTLSRTIWCIKYQAVVAPRLIMRTPWLAGQLQHIVYCPAENAMQPFPTDTYYVNGGKTERVGPSFYKSWA